MNGWGPSTFGDPCPGCGFEWSIPDADACRVVADSPRRFELLTTGSAGARRHPDLRWSDVGYICHVGDSIRIWAERIASVAFGRADVPPYSQDLLGEARHYDEVALPAALWSLRRAVADWDAALELVRDAPFVMHHEEVGAMALDDVVRIRAHDVVNHAWDVERIVATAQHDGAVPT